MHIPRRRITLGPGASLLLLFTLIATSAALLGWLALRLVMAGGGTLLEQSGVRRLVDDCMIMLRSPDLADRLLAYSWIAGLGAVIILGVATLVIQVRRTTGTVCQLHMVNLPLTQAISDACRRADLQGRVTLVESEQPFAFCYGMFRSRVCISTGLVATLGAGRELDAVFLHEKYHLRHHDPLLMAVAQAATRAFFFLPLVNDLYQHYRVVRELAADQTAIAAQGVREPMAAALYHLALYQQENGRPTLVAYVLERSDAGTLNARLDALLGEASDYPFRSSRQRVRRTLLVTVAFSVLLSLSYAAHGGLVLLTIGHWIQGSC